MDSPTNEGFNFLNLFIELLNLAVAIIYFSGMILEFMCLILFINHFIRKTPHFCTAFFFLLICGYFIDFMSVISLVLRKVYPSELSDDMDRLNTWYTALLLGPWNTLMAFNRFAAVQFWQLHSKFWRKWPLAASIGLLIAYPFIVDGFIFANPQCALHIMSHECAEFASQHRLIEFFSNTINILVAAILGYATSLACRLHMITLTPETRKFQRYLFFQSLFSTLILASNLLYILLMNVSNTATSRTTTTESTPASSEAGISPTANIEYLVMLYQAYFHLSATILLFFLS